MDIGGSAAINGTSAQNSTNWDSYDDYFQYLFGVTKSEMKSRADYTYTNPAINTSPCEGITWVTLTEGNDFKISSDTWGGSGILVVEGTAIVTGGDFDGIIYIIGGDFNVPVGAAGNPVIKGTMLIEGDSNSTAWMRGNLYLEHNSTAISDALGGLRWVSWREAAPY